jgi:hypothetical protein
MAFAIRVPKSVTLGRLRPPAARAFRAAPIRRRGHRPEDPRHVPAGMSGEDVELEVRERLYGIRSTSR